MTTRTIVGIIPIFVLTACGAQPQPEAPEQAEGVGEVTNPAAEQPISILRPDVEQPTIEQQVLEPLRVVIGFPEGGSQLDADAVGLLEQLLGSEQLALGGPIRIEGHSDAGGSDSVNLDASQERALAVAAWLIDQGVQDDRIDVIVFGEQNPVQPNALPDGSANEPGRALNRRVEVYVPTVATAEDPGEDSVESSD